MSWIAGKGLEERFSLSLFGFHRFRQLFYLPALALIVLFGFSGCGDDPADDIKVIRVGVLPDESEEKLSARYMPLLRHLEKATGITFELVIPANYDGLLTLFNKEEVDLAYFGGFTFLKARSDSGAVPLVMRDVDTRFTSLFIVKSDFPAMSLKELRGRTFSFGSRLSTSGHLMPRHFLVREDIEPEEFFAKVTYSGAHDKTVALVREGAVDAGVANALIVRKMLTDHRSTKTEIRILWETPPYADYVWAVQHKIPTSVRQKIVAAFLEISSERGDHEAILKSVGANIFLPARGEDFKELQSISEGLDMLK